MKSLLLVLLLSSGLLGQPDTNKKPVRVISINAERFAFNPSKITVKQGQLIELVLTSDDTDHGFRMTGSGIDVAIPPQSRGEVRVRFYAKEIRRSRGHSTIYFSTSRRRRTMAFRCPR